MDQLIRCKMIIKLFSSDLIQLVSVCTSELRGSAGLEDVFMRSMQKIGLDDSIIREKFAGVTTDGESANIGRNTGLWPRLEKLAG